MMNETEFRSAALAILTDSLRRGLRAKAAYNATFKAVASFDTGGYCWAVPAIPSEFIAKHLTKKQDRVAAAKADCHCTDCGGIEVVWCAKDAHLWAFRRREMRRSLNAPARRRRHS